MVLLQTTIGRSTSFASSRNRFAIWSEPAFARLIPFTVGERHQRDHVTCVPLNSVPNDSHTCSVLGDRFVSEAADDAQPSTAGCMHGTRTRILSKFVEWAIGDPMAIYWLAGMAGTGKSSIAVTLCRMLRNEPFRKTGQRQVAHLCRLRAPCGLSTTPLPFALSEIPFARSCLSVSLSCTKQFCCLAIVTVCLQAFAGPFRTKTTPILRFLVVIVLKEVINYASNMLRCTGWRLRPMEANRASDGRTCRPA